MSRSQHQALDPKLWLSLIVSARWLETAPRGLGEAVQGIWASQPRLLLSVLSQHLAPLPHVVFLPVPTSLFMLFPQLLSRNDPQEDLSDHGGVTETH